MSYTWLELVAATTTELGLGSAPTVVAGASDVQTQQLGALANRCGEMLLRMREWTQLQAEWDIAVSPPIVRTGTVTSGSTMITGLSSTAGLVAGTYAIIGNYITQAARLVSVDSATQVTMTEPATASGSAQSITFSKDTYAAPADMLAPINRTHWDRTRRWELIGPMSPQEDEWMRSGIVATGPRRRFRVVGRGTNTFRIWPPPTALDSPAALAFEYITTNWAQDVLGIPKARFTADDDTCVFPDDIMLMGVKWLWLQAKGMEYAAFRDDWMTAAQNASATDGGAPTLSLAQGSWPLLIGPGNVPDTGYGGP